MPQTRFAYLLGIVLIFCLVSIYTFDQKIDPNGDNASYYLLAKGIQLGEGYSNYYTVSKQPENHFPPGYPVFLSVIMILTNAGIIGLKIVNDVLFLFSLLLLLQIARRLSLEKWLTLLIVFSCLLNPNMLRYSTIIMSEMLFMVLSLLIILLTMNSSMNKKWYKDLNFLSTIILLIAAYYVRSIGVALLIGVCAHYVFHRKGPRAIVLLIGFVTGIIPWIIRGFSVEKGSYINQLTKVNPYQPELGDAGLLDYIHRFGSNVVRYSTSEIYTSLFRFNDSSISDPSNLFENIIGFCVVSLILFGFVKLANYKILIGTYLIVFLGILLLWPEVWKGPRFIIPLVPIFLIGLWNGAYYLCQIVITKFWPDRPILIENALFSLLAGIILIFVPQVQLLHTISKGDYAPKMRSYIAAANYVKLNSPSNSIVCCRKQNIFYLFSDRKVTGYRKTKNAELLFQDLDNKGVDYIIIDEFGFRSNSIYLKPAGLKYPEKTEFVYIAPESKTFVGLFHPELGYSGAFYSGKRSGFGTMRWKNGSCFDGDFKNDKANGYGELYMPNGNVLKGGWSDFDPDGETYLYSSSGSLIEKRIYNHGELIKSTAY